MRIDEINAMADEDIRENEQLEKLAEIHYPMCEWAEEQCVVRRLAFMNGYNKAKEVTNNYNVIDSDIGTIEVLHDLLLDVHGYELDSIILKRARELTAKMYESLYNKQVMNKIQTPINKLHSRILFNIGLDDNDIKELDRLVKECINYEKEQLMKTWTKAIDQTQERAWNIVRAYDDFDDYYNETFNK